MPAFADATPICNVQDFGAKGDGASLDTSSSPLRLPHA
jgi:hypothetical protein